MTIHQSIALNRLVLTEADNATEISLAENQVREAMHPDNQCGAFQRLLAEGLPVEDIAARFGVKPVVVTQRLRLAAVSPKLRALYRAGETTVFLTLVEAPIPSRPFRRFYVRKIC